MSRKQPGARLQAAIDMLEALQPDDFIGVDPVVIGLLRARLESLQQMTAPVGGEYGAPAGAAGAGA